MTTDQNKVALYHLAYQLSQEKLSSQADAAIGADARAMSFSGLSLTAGVLLLGLAKDAYVPLVLLIGAATFTLAAAIAGYAARPIKFKFPGARYSDLSTDISQNIDISEVLNELATFSDKHIDENTVNILKNSSILKTSYLMSMLGMIISLVPQFLFVISN